MGLFGHPNVDKMKDRGDVNGLIKALKYLGKPNVRLFAATALGELKDARAVEPLIIAFTGANTNNDVDIFMRHRAARALGQIGDPRAVVPLIAALKDKKVREDVVDALGDIGDIRAVEPLIDSLENGFNDYKVIYALQKIGDARAVEPLIAVLKDPKQIYNHKWAAKALGTLADPRAVDSLINTIKEMNRDAQWAAFEALGEIKDVRALGPLSDILKDPNQVYNHDRVAKALDQIGWQPGNDTIGASYWIVKQKWQECVRIGAPAILPLIARFKKGDHLYCREAAEALVGVYKSGGLDEAEKKLILSHRDEITKPHVDSVDGCYHYSDGFGVDFPL